jgi:hypothetical protein
LMGLVESFVSPIEGVPGWFKIALGLALGAAYWSYLLGGGRSTHQRAERLSSK